jgi:hypothetical protein
MPGTDVPQRVTFLYRSVRLGAELLALLGERRHVNVISLPVELAKGPPTDVVVIDVPAQDRWAACEQVRRHYRGPLIVLLGQGESGHALPPDHNRTLLRRPFSIRQLSVALAMPAQTLPNWDPAGHLQLVPSPAARSGGTKPSPGPTRNPAAQAAPRLGRSWRDRRLVRISAISVMAALLFMGAFAVVSQGDRCGSGCDKLAGADLVSPSSSTVPLGQDGPAATGPGPGRVDPTTNDPGASPTASGESRVGGAGGSATPSSATRASLSGAPTPTSAPDRTSAPDPTRPQPTAAPTTTRPKTSTSTSTSTTATTTTTRT